MAKKGAKAASRTKANVKKRAQPDEPVGEPTEESSEALRCWLCAKPTKLRMMRPGLPVYHAICAEEAGLDHGQPLGRADA